MKRGLLLGCLLLSLNSCDTLNDAVNAACQPPKEHSERWTIRFLIFSHGFGDGPGDGQQFNSDPSDYDKRDTFGITPTTTDLDPETQDKLKGFPQ